MQIYDQDRKLQEEGVVLTWLEAKGLLNLLRKTDYSLSKPCFTKFAAELAESLMKKGIR